MSEQPAEMSDAEYLRIQQQVLLLGSLARLLPDLGPFIRRAQNGLDLGALLAPSHFIAGQKKLELVIKIARAVHQLQLALPTVTEAMKIDADAAELVQRLGIGKDLADG